MESITEQILKKWDAVLNHADLPKIEDPVRRNVTAMVLENTERSLRESSIGNSLLTEGPVNVVGNVDTFDPVLISLVRRSLPNLMAYDVCGVQPMTGPTGLIFALRANYANTTANTSEAFYGEPNTAFSTVVTPSDTLGDEMIGTVPGNTSQTSVLATANLYNYGDAVATATAEAYGNSTVEWPQMAITIEKVTVTAQSRLLKAEYSLELAQDLKAIHGLDAEAELSNILSAEILAEINREVVRTINVTAVRGSNGTTTTTGIFDLDTDSNGRWAVEKFKGLMYHIEREANQIAKDTRRGRGNLIICSSDVASALAMAGVLDYAPALSSNLAVDDTGNTFAGVLNGRFKVYIDPYTTGNYMTIGYRGANPFDAGLFYCPYVPLQMVRAVGENNFQPKIGFKTRYGMVENPFAKGSSANSTNQGVLEQDKNTYYRRTLVRNLL